MLVHLAIFRLVCVLSGCLHMFWHKISLTIAFYLLVASKFLLSIVKVIMIVQPPRVQIKLRKEKQFLASNKKRGSAGWIRSALEAAVFCGWLLVTGIGGYFLGHTPLSQEQTCPPQPSPVILAQQTEVPKCIPRPPIFKPTQPPLGTNSGVGHALGAVDKEGGFTMDDIKRMWKCSHAVESPASPKERMFPSDSNIDKTKWKSIVSVEPKAFFERYLSQYPGDTRAIQPVVVFSHKPLMNSSLDHIAEVCKVIDVAVVPDTPGVCVAVTETFHDVASYHMLHAEKQPDGSFSLTANSLEGRELPNEQHYTQARALLLSYFDNVDAVAAMVKETPRYGKNKVAVGTLLEDVEELELFKNSLASADKQGINKNKFCVFTTSDAVQKAVKAIGVQVIYLQKLSDVGRTGAADVGPKFRRYFLQAWLAFAVAAGGNKMMWQSPGTIWLERPDNIVNSFPLVETLWTFKGRKDRRAAPFFSSFDFFVPSAAERPVHLMHEILLHFDLVLAWGSLDAVASYRLSENNSRYGTTTFLMPPYRVLHTDLMHGDATKLKQAVELSKAETNVEDKLIVVVIPHEGLDPKDAKKLLVDSGLWFVV